MKRKLSNYVVTIFMILPIIGILTGIAMLLYGLNGMMNFANPQVALSSYDWGLRGFFTLAISTLLFAGMYAC